MEEINRLEKDSILYYQGGGKNVELLYGRRNLRKFYDADNSYMVINALLMPGISNERARLLEEKKQADPVMLDHMNELIEVYCRLYSAMCKYTYGYKHDRTYYTYRDDRMNTLEFLKQGQMYSFMSTRKGNVANANFREKDGLLLLEVEAGGEIEHIDVNVVLGEESIYPQEQEILFAPFVLLDMEPVEMTEEEKDYKDMYGEPPKAKYLLHLEVSSVVPQMSGKNEDKLNRLYADIMDADSLNNAMQVWETFMKGGEPGDDVTEYYIIWKEKIQMYLRLCFAEIKYKVINDRQGCQMRENQLKAELSVFLGDTNKKRKKYKRYVSMTNIVISFCGIIMLFFMALGFSDELQAWTRYVSLVLGMVVAIIDSLAKGFAWKGKLQQRTDTYLKLDELARDLRYDECLDEDTLNEYVERYKKIVKKDNKMGKENALVMGKYSEQMMKELKEKQES